MKSKPSILLLTLYLSLAAIGAVIVTPALPAIATTFSVTAGYAEWSVAIYILGYGVGQLFHGPLSNQFGRKKVLLLGLLFGVIASGLGIFFIYQHNFTAFLITRFIASFALSSGLVLSMVMIKDSFDQISARKAFSVVVMNFAFVPFVAIAVGGILTTHIGWLSTQYLFIVIILLSILLLPLLPETLSLCNRKQISPQHVVVNYIRLFMNGRFVRLMMVYCMAASVSYIFNGLAPIICIKLLGLSAQHYSIFSIVTSFGFVFGAMLSSRLSAVFSAKKLIIAGLLLVTLSSVVMASVFLLQAPSPLILFALAAFAFTGASLVTPNASMQSMSVIDDHASGAAVLNTSALVVASLLLSILGHAIIAMPSLLPISLLIVGLLGLLALLIKK